jgi:Domain of unknown function (DUF4251)
MKTLVRIFVVLTVFICGSTVVFAQSTKQEKQAAKKAAIKKMIDSGVYVFKANYALPLRGSQKNLTPDYYDLIVTKDTITAYLPYYGQSYTAPNDIYTNEGGIKFKTSDFSYIIKQNKNGSWQISIKPKDTNISNWRSVQQMTLNISTSGYASLQVVSSNRDMISFDGTIEDIKSK